MTAGAERRLFQMRLAPQAMDRAEHGHKRLELRLHDGKRQSLRLGDEICFTETGDDQHRLLVVVTGLLHYRDFAALAADVPVSWLGYPDDGHRQLLRDRLALSMSAIYTPGQVRQHGVLGIRFRLEGEAP